MLEALLRQHRLIQAPMAGVQGPELAIAVSRAGGVGSLPAAMLDERALREALAQLAAEAPGPCNVNFFCHQNVAPTAQSLRDWQQALDGYYRELGADRDAPPGAARSPFGATALAALQDCPPALVSFHFGLPSPELLQGVKATGAQVLASATSVDEALWLRDHGADGVIAQGIEAGGHQGCFLPVERYPALRCLELVRAIAAEVELPLVAAGGIATRDDARAALEAGAVAVQVGSAFLRADEAKTSALHRAALAGEAARQTALTNVFSGRRARGIVNRAIAELGPISASAPVFPHAATAMAPLRAVAEAAGSGDFSPLWSGERGYLSEALPAAEITRAIRPD